MPSPFASVQEIDLSPAVLHKYTNKEAAQIAQRTVTGFGKLVRNGSFLIFWSGNIVSSIGDAFFALAVVWIVFTATGSLFETALIQVVWHLDRVFLAPFTGVLADKRDRSRLLWVSNVLSGLVVGALALILGTPGHPLTLVLALVAIVLLNSSATLGRPAAASVMPDLVGRDTLLTANSAMATVGGVVGFIGPALAGLVVGLWGGPAALALDAVSFGVAAVAVVTARLPQRATTVPHEGLHLFRDLREGWATIQGQPLLRRLVWLSPLLNIASFAGPLYVGLVRLHWHAGATALGTLLAAEAVGALAVASLVPWLEHHIAAGKLFAWGFIASGLLTVAIAYSPIPGIADVFAFVGGAVSTAGGVAIGPLYVLLVPEEYRGRLWGLHSAVATSTIPLATLLGAWLATRYGPAPLIGISGLWVTGVGLLALSNRDVRHARYAEAVASPVGSGSPAVEDGLD